MVSVDLETHAEEAKLSKETANCVLNYLYTILLVAIIITTFDSQYVDICRSQLA